MLVVWAIGAAVTYIMLPFDWFMEGVGFMAVFIEAMLGSPQFMRNFKSKSTQGMSIQMVLMWLAGDMFKTGYFIIREAPAQFWLCGTLQVSVESFSRQFQFFKLKKKPNMKKAVLLKFYNFYFILGELRHCHSSSSLDLPQKCTTPSVTRRLAVCPPWCCTKFASTVTNWPKTKFRK